MEIPTKTIHALEYEKILERLANCSKLEQSKTVCLNLKPLEDPEQVQEALDFTAEALHVLDFGLDIPVEFVMDISSLTLKNEYFVEEELLDTAKTMRTSRIVRNFLKENTEFNSKLNTLAFPLYVNKELEDRIFDTFDDAGNVKQNATPELAGLYSSLRDTENNLKQSVNALLNNSEFSKHLQEQIYTIRDDRVVFQVRASSKSKVPGIVHDVSATNRTFYIEPQSLVPINNKIRELKTRIYAEIVRILTELSREVRRDLPKLLESEQILAQIDFHFAKARYAVKTKSVQPELSSEKLVNINKMRHPLLIGAVANIVENDFEIGDGYKSIIITGSNTGGKTVALKTVGLFLLMTKSGMFLPCLGAKIYPFKKVFADIGDEQNILQNLSTFSSHMSVLIDILNNADEESFILIDEICAGTDPQEGAILAEVILREFAAKNAFSVTTTHYGELKALEYYNDYFKNACVEFDTKTLSPTYRLIIGIPGLSNAISISAGLGLKPELVEQAKSLLIQQRDNSALVVEKLQDTKQQLDENLKTAQELRDEADELKKSYEKQLNEHKKEKKKVLKGIRSQFSAEIEDAKSEIKQILKEMREEKSEKIARRSLARLTKLEQQNRANVNALTDKDKYNEIDWDNVKAGDTVMIKDLNQGVTILQTPDKNGNVYVKMGLINTRVKKDRLAVYDKTLSTKTILPTQYTQNFELKKYEISSTLDLRGHRVEEALDELEGFLDEASLANLTPVYVIHGHGTGALKSAVRDFLTTSPYVAKFRPGEGAEGGDGVSVIDLK